LASRSWVGVLIIGLAGVLVIGLGITLLVTPSSVVNNHGTPVGQFYLELNLVNNESDYHLGDPINVTLTVTNITNKTLNFSLAPSGWDLLVYNDTNNLLCQWSSGKIFPMYVLFMTLAPGENVSESMTWSQTCDAVMGDFGTPIAPVSQGTYCLVGVYGNLRTLPVQIKIV
jgi:hypothetical protein